MTHSQNNYQKMITGLPWMDGAGTQYYPELYLPQAPTWMCSQTPNRNKSRTTLLEAYKSDGPMLKEYEYHYRRALRESRRMQGMISDTSRRADHAMHEGSGESQPAWISVW